MDDPVISKVLEMIATNQREHSRVLERIAEDVGEIRTDNAMTQRDMAELKAWRRDTVDPFIASAKDLSSQAKGAGRVIKFVYAAGGVIGVGAIYKFAVTVLPGLISSAPK